VATRYYDADINMAAILRADGDMAVIDRAIGDMIVILRAPYTDDDIRMLSILHTYMVAILHARLDLKKPTYGLTKEQDVRIKRAHKSIKEGIDYEER
jgi:hypothetical protein